MKRVVKKWPLLYESLRAVKCRAIKVTALVEAFGFRLSKMSGGRNGQFPDVEFTCCDEVFKKAADRGKIKFFVSPNEKEDIIRLLSEPERDRIIAAADEITSHRFRILGQTVSFEDDIDWHLDNTSGYRWPLRYFKRLLPVFNTTDNTDGKVPYELSRFNHLTFLGMAHRITGDEKYAAEFIKQIESWIAGNPYPYGINWTCAMDVAIRACNLIVTLNLLADSKRMTNQHLFKLQESLYQHGKYVMDNLEQYWSCTSNHYISDIVGLLYLGTFFPGLEAATAWKEFAIKELIREMEKQVHPDGCDFEASTCYHRLVLEHFFFGTLLTVINDNEFNGRNYKEVCQKIFGEKYTDRLLRMFEAVLYLLKPNGQMPQIGDNDSGRLHKFATREVLDMRYLLTFGAIFFKEFKFKIKEFGFCEEALWIFGEKGYRIWNDLKENCLSNIKSRAFSNAGWYVIRHNDNYCLVSCGSNGQNGNGGHAHNDKLSFELMLNKEDILVDPGTYTYTQYPEQRNRFRSTGYHNTIKFNGYEQNDITEKDIFSLPEKVRIKQVSLKERDNDIIFQGEIQYSGLTQIRKITLDKESGNCQIQDSVPCSEPLTGKLTFHLSPNLTTNGNSILIKETKAKVASIEVKGSNLEKGEYDYSPEYGVKIKAQCLAANISVNNEIKFINNYINRF